MKIISKKKQKIIKFWMLKLLYNLPLSIIFLDIKNKITLNKIKRFYNKISNQINSYTSIHFPEQYIMNYNTKLPQSTWYIKKENSIAEVNYGSSVYCHENGLVEGVWDDKFSELNYASAEHLFGSGIFWSSEKITFSPPSYILEGIFFLLNKKNSNYYASNSLSCLLSLIKDLNIDLQEIISTIDSSTSSRLERGIFGYNPVIYENDNLILMLFCYHNFSITNNGLKIETKLKINRFKTFHDYNNFLKEKISILINNGKDRCRTNTPKLLPLSTISSGYDSTASAAIVQNFGVHEAVTIDVNVYDKDDSGLATAKRLGMDCHPCRHPFGQSISDLNIKEDFYERNLDELSIFLATFGLGDDSSWLAFKPYIEHKIVFTGHGGDEIWYKDRFIGNGLRKITCFELSLGEYRLHHGFARVAVPYIGTSFANYVYRINFLKEMIPYTLNNEYDRPIPRRFAEEAGIPRGTFAQIKRATNPNLVSVKKYKLDSFLKHIKYYRSIIH